jgi:hypothetical protein
MRKRSLGNGKKWKKWAQKERGGCFDALKNEKAPLLRRFEVYGAFSKMGF